MIVCRSASELRRLRDVNRLVGQVLEQLREAVAPGVTTEDLDAIAEREIRGGGAVPAFKGYKGYPATICASVNEQVVHGIPSPKTVLSEGDIISIDLGAKMGGFFGDSAVTVGVGRIERQAADLLRVTEDVALEGDRSRPARSKSIGYRPRGTEPRGKSGVFGGARVRRARHRIGAARRAADSELRRPGPRAAAGGRHGAGDRADGESRRRRRESAQGRLDGSHVRSQSLGAFRAHGCRDVGRRGSTLAARTEAGEGREQ